MNDLLQPYILTVVQALLGLLVAALLAGIAIMRKKIEAWLDARTSVQQRDLLHKLASEAAALVEATFNGAGGPAKLSDAVDYVSKHLDQLGVSITGAEIRAAIEKAVQDFNMKAKGGAINGK